MHICLVQRTRTPYRAALVQRTRTRGPYPYLKVNECLQPSILTGSPRGWISIIIPKPPTLHVPWLRDGSGARAPGRAPYHVRVSDRTPYDVRVSCCGAPWSRRLLFRKWPHAMPAPAQHHPCARGRLYVVMRLTLSFIVITIASIPTLPCMPGSKYSLLPHL